MLLGQFEITEFISDRNFCHLDDGGYLGFHGHHTLLESFVMESAMMFSGQVKGRLVHPNYGLQ